MSTWWTRSGQFNCNPCHRRTLVPCLVRLPQRSTRRIPVHPSQTRTLGEEERDAYVSHKVTERFVLPSKNIEQDAGLVGGDLSAKDLAVHESFTSTKLNDDFSHFIPNLHGQRSCERERDCDKSGTDQSMSGDDESEKTDRKQRGRKGR